MVPGGVDVSIDATGGEYGKGWTHKLELMVGLEQDTSEMINECIYSTRKFGKVGIIGDYVACEHFHLLRIPRTSLTLRLQIQTTSMSEPSWRMASTWLAVGKPLSRNVS
jgi:threonine dehydrogenase-like Zn-dependent dehydrogenase